MDYSDALPGPMTMYLRHLALLSATALLAACTTAPPAPVAEHIIIPELPQASGDQQLSFDLASGTYRCDLGKEILVQRDGQDANHVRIGWAGSLYDLNRNHSYSGLPRYEDAGSGLVWIDLPWKSILLDGRRNAPLASDCTQA